MSAMEVVSPCPVCGGALTEADVECDMHLTGCGNSFPVSWIPEVEYETLESDSDLGPR